MQVKYRYFIAVTLFLLFFSLRFYHLGFHDLWYDEVVTNYYAAEPSYTWNAPLYYAVLHFWTKIFGTSEASLRFPSLIFSLAAVIILFLLATRLFKRKVGFWAAAIMGFSSLHLWYAQEARNYSMALFFGLVSTYLLFVALEKKKALYWIGFALSSLAGIYTNYFFIFLSLMHGLYLLIFFRRFALNIKHLIVFLSLGVGFLPYSKRFATKFFAVWAGFWVQKPTISSLAITLENFLLGYNATVTAYRICDLIILLLLLAALMKLKKKSLRPKIVLCLFVFLGPILLAFFFSRFFFPVYIDRGLIIASPGLYILLGLGIEALPRKPLKTAVSASLCGLLLYGAVTYHKDLMSTPLKHHAGTYIKKPVRPIVRLIEEKSGKADIVALSNESLRHPFEYYAKKDTPLYYLFDPLLNDTSWNRPFLETKTFLPVNKVERMAFKRLWLGPQLKALREFKTGQGLSGQ